MARQLDLHTLNELQAAIDRFVADYKNQRPHRAIGRRTPPQAYDSKIKTHPDQPSATHFRVRHNIVDRHGKLTLRHDSRLHHIGIGRAYADQPVTMLIADLDIRIINNDGETIRQLTLDPTKDYQPRQPT